MVSVPSRPGVTQSFLIVDMAEAKPQAIALLYTGGGGRIGLRREQGELKFRGANFLVRAAPELARDGVQPVVMDAPSDQGELTEEYRVGSAQTVDARAVIAELKHRFPGLPIYLVGTSRGTISAAVLGRELGAEIAGVVLTSTMFGSDNSRRRVPSLRGFDYGGIGSRLLFVHHQEDGCEHTPYASAARLALSAGHRDRRQAARIGPVRAVRRAWLLRPRGADGRRDLGLDTEAPILPAHRLSAR